VARDAQPPLKTNDKQAIPQSPVLNEDMLQFLEEVSAHNRGYLKHKLAFAVLLKFYEREGRPLLNEELIPLELLTSLSIQLDCDIEDCENFDWEGRTA
tara:strand:+ start:244 stop:537 length:294 start_codon:yes stop_codon:yes gene_type:complete